jgi:recombination protein RecT
MSTEQVTTKQYFNSPIVQQKFEKLLGQKAQGFIASVLQTVGNNKLLSKAEPATIFNAAATAASLDLPINQSLGRAWIVPFKGQAQFQIGYKGFVELAQRSGKYRAINAIAVYENQYEGFDSLEERLIGDFTKQGEGRIVGYAAYFELLNGFKKTVFWSSEKVQQHAKRFSKSYTNGPWKTDFDAMAKKTVLKHTLSNWGILSIEMQTATLADQAIQPEEGQYRYDDNVVNLDELNEKEETARVISFLEKVEDFESLEVLEDSLSDQTITEDAKEAINSKRDELSKVAAK